MTAPQPHRNRNRLSTRSSERPVQRETPGAPSLDISWTYPVGGCPPGFRVSTVEVCVRLVVSELSARKRGQVVPRVPYRRVRGLPNWISRGGWPERIAADLGGSEACPHAGCHCGAWLPLLLLVLIGGAAVWVHRDPTKLEQAGSPVVFRSQFITLDSPEDWTIACVFGWLIFFRRTCEGGRRTFAPVG